MPARTLTLAVTLVGIAAALPAISSGSTATTVAPTPAERTAILEAFGDPPSAFSCLIVRLAASDHRYATVRFRRITRCRRWAFNGVNVLKRGSDDHWKVVFEGSSYRCPLPRIPRQVQHDLGICPKP
jgi:hypothetical protein